MKRTCLQKASVCAILWGLTLWCMASLAASAASLNRHEGLARLAGGDECKCDACTDDYRYRWECDHWNPLDPNEPCSTTECIVNKMYFPKCPPQAGGADCSVKWSDTALRHEQWLHHVTTGSTLCQTVGQGIIDDLYNEQPCEVINKVASAPGGMQGRCQIPSAACQGALIQTEEPRNGRYICK